ncbi:MAG: hemin receptor [Gammaproteobacteria bacterium]|nr:MAG: hemin receptor [Gammaproteobacteria bacterium]
MNATKIHLIRASFALVAPASQVVGLIFYRNLFELDPKLKSLFPADLNQQSAKLMQMLSAAVSSLDNLDDLVPVVQQLAKRHVKYGVTPQHYQTVGAALLNTLVEGLGDDLSAEAFIAWKELYLLLSHTMITAAYSEARISEAPSSEARISEVPSPEVALAE